MNLSRSLFRRLAPLFASLFPLHRRFGWVAAVLAALMLSGCATGMSAADRARLQRIGVVSLMGEEMNFNLFTFLSVTDQHYTLRPGLRYDDVVEESMVRALQAGGKQVVRLDAARPALRGGIRERVLGRLPFYDSKRVAPELNRLAAEHRLDAIVLVCPMETRIPGDYLISGYGVFAHSNIMGLKPQPYICSQVQVYDPRTSKLMFMAFCSAHAGEGNPITLHDIRWQKTYDGYSASEKARILEATVAMPKVLIPATLRGIGLTDRLPAAP